MEDSLEGSSQSSWGGSVEVDHRVAGEGTESGRKPTPPPPPPQNLKPTRREAPQPKPKPGIGRYTCALYMAMVCVNPVSSRCVCIVRGIVHGRK